MTADLTPAQAARLAQIEAAPYAPESAVDRVAAALWTADCGVVSYGWGDLAESSREKWRRFALAALDAMRGAPDDGAIGRVLALAEDLALHTVEPTTNGERGFINGLDHAADRIRAAVGAPATAEGGGHRPFDPTEDGGW